MTTSGRGMSHIERPHQGETNDWWTPPEIVQALGAFDLDPCAGVGQKPLAKTAFTLPETDGLAAKWHGRVFCNPPYGPNVGAWAKKLADHGNGILLIFARVETRAWRIIWSTADGILFPFRRITFLRPGGARRIVVRRHLRSVLMDLPTWKRLDFAGSRVRL